MMSLRPQWKRLQHWPSCLGKPLRSEQQHDLQERKPVRSSWDTESGVLCPWPTTHYSGGRHRKTCHCCHLLQRNTYVYQPPVWPQKEFSALQEILFLRNAVYYDMIMLINWFFSRRTLTSIKHTWTSLCVWDEHIMVKCVYVWVHQAYSIAHCLRRVRKRIENEWDVIVFDSYLVYMWQDDTKRNTLLVTSGDFIKQMHVKTAL